MQAEGHPDHHKQSGCTFLPPILATQLLWVFHWFSRKRNTFPTKTLSLLRQQDCLLYTHSQDLVYLLDLTILALRARLL